MTWELCWTNREGYAVASEGDTVLLATSPRGAGWVPVQMDRDNNTLWRRPKADDATADKGRDDE